MDRLLNYYNATATHNYVFGVLYKGRIMAYLVALDLEGYAVMFNEKPTTSKGQTVIKYRSTKIKRDYLESHAVLVCDLMDIDELKASRLQKTNRHGKAYTENCGECFERLIAEHFHTRQNQKSNLKHTDGGDIVINGVPYQVKYESGSIAVGS